MNCAIETEEWLFFPLSSLSLLYKVPLFHWNAAAAAAASLFFQTSSQLLLCRSRAGMEAVNSCNMQGKKGVFGALADQ